MRLQVAITELIERLGLSDPSQVTKYSVSQRFGVIPSSELENRTMQAKSLENYKIVSQNNLVLNRFNAYKGALGLAPNRGVVSPDYFVAEINERIADPCFIRYFLLSQSSADLIKRDMGGMGSGDPDSSAFSRFDVRSLMSMKIPIVDLHTQSAIADYLDRETAEIDGMRADLDEMERLLTERRTNAIDDALKEAAKHGTIPLGYVATTVAGGTPSTSNSFYWCREEEGHPWVTIGDMSSTSVVTTTAKRVTEAGIDAARLSLGEPGTILFAMYGATLGAVSRLGLTASWNQAILGIFPDKSVLSPDFLELSLIASKKHLVTLHRGNTQNNLNAEQVKGLRVPLPPLTEQRRIADEIDRETAEIDSMLSDITKLRDLLVERRAAVISAAVTGQIDIPVSPTHKDEPHA